MSETANTVRWWHRLQGKPFSVLSLLWALSWCGIALFVFAESHRFAEAARIGEQQGHFVCGTSSLGKEPAIPAAIAALLAAVGEYRGMALVGIPTALYVGLWLLGSWTP